MPAAHGWLKKVRSSMPEPSGIVTVTIDCRRRVSRLNVLCTLAITVACCPIPRSPICSTAERSM